MKVYYTEKPEKLKYEPLPGTTMNVVYLRRNIHEEVLTGDGRMGEEGVGTTAVRAWAADEVTLTTDATKEEVEAQFDDLTLSAGEKPTLEERVSALEDLAMAQETEAE